MICDRCYRMLADGDHGVGLCPMERRREGAAVRQDTIIGGFWAENAWREPRYFESQKKYERALDASGLRLKTPRWAKSWAFIDQRMLDEAKRLVERVTVRQKTVAIETRVLEDTLTIQTEAEA